MFVAIYIQAHNTRPRGHQKYLRNESVIEKKLDSVLMQRIANV